MKLKSRTVVITGGNRGIGLAFAEACARQKAKVILAVRNDDPALVDDLIKLGAQTAGVIECDLITREGVQALADRLQGMQVDLLFNNAGQLTGGLIEEQSLDDIYNMFQVNVNALVHLSRAVVPQMVAQRSGKIINHASVSAIMHFPCASTYAAAKAAVWAFTDCLQQELKGTGVSTLCLFTPGIKTRMFDKIEDLYSKNLETPKDSMSPEAYAFRIMQAVSNDNTYLEPQGATGFAFFVATHFKKFFARIISGRFSRKKRALRGEDSLK